MVLPLSDSSSTVAPGKFSEQLKAARSAFDGKRYARRTESASGRQEQGGHTIKVGYFRIGLRIRVASFTTRVHPDAAQSKF